MPAESARTRSLSFEHATRAAAPTPTGDGEGNEEGVDKGDADVDASRVENPRAETVLLGMARLDALFEVDADVDRLATRDGDSRADDDALPLEDGLALEDRQPLGDALALALSGS